MKKHNKKGFTIVELVIVIAVIGILAAVLIPTFSNIITKANDSAALQEATNAYKEAYALAIADGAITANEVIELKATDGTTVTWKFTFTDSQTATVNTQPSKFSKYDISVANGKVTVSPKS